MVLLVGSKKATPKLLELVPQKFKDLSEQCKKYEIDSLVQWIVKQPHLPRLKAEQLLVFLHAADYSIEKAKDMLDSYYTTRTKAPELFTERHAHLYPHIPRAFKIAYFVCLPETVKTYDGNQVVVLKLIDTDPANADFVEGVKTTFAMLDLIIGKYPLSKGLEIIMDMEGLALGHITKIDFSALKIFLTFCQESLIIPLRAVHVINTFSLINQVMPLIKPFLRAELLKILYFYTPNEFSKLTSTYIPIESLPRDFGGTLDSLDAYQSEMFRQIQLASDWLEELEAYKVEEAKRLGRKRSDLNVCDGSFRKLNLD